MACEGQTNKELAFHGSIAPVHFTNSTSNRSALLWGTTSGEFPDGQKDEHGEQLDLRPRNSWTYNLDEVPLQELLQVSFKLPFIRLDVHVHVYQYNYTSFIPMQFPHFDRLSQIYKDCFNLCHKTVKLLVISLPYEKFLQFHWLRAVVYFSLI